MTSTTQDQIASLFKKQLEQTIKLEQIEKGFKETEDILDRLEDKYNKWEEANKPFTVRAIRSKEELADQEYERVFGHKPTKPDFSKFDRAVEELRTSLN